MRFAPVLSSITDKHEQNGDEKFILFRDSISGKIEEKNPDDYLGLFLWK
jgi:hypothetical protein